MARPRLTEYDANSAAAVLRIVAMFLMVDGEISDAEIEAIDRLGLLETLKVDRERFALILDSYCDDLISHAGTSRYVALADPDWVDAVLAPVTEPERRRFIAAALLKLAESDDHFADSELAVLRRLLTRWELDLDSLMPAS
jgi:uncharacterized tellurite resistance protein B-like protein